MWHGPPTSGICERGPLHRPGRDPRPRAAERGLLCVGAVIPAKGHDVLLDALATVSEDLWRCTCVGSLDRDPAFADAVRRRAPARVRFTGPLVGAALDRAYAAADLLVLP